MGVVRMVRRSSVEPIEEPPTLHARAADNLQFIRAAMERASSFTAVSGWGLIAVGATACAAAFIASRQQSESAWLFVWLAEAALAFGVSLATMWRKARAAGDVLWSRPGKKLALNAAPPMIAGAILTPILHRAGMDAALPSAWLLLYGAGVVTGGAFSVQLVPIMGACLMTVGAAALFVPTLWRDWVMACGFGAIHIVFGILIARKHGG